jgi:hypothetical protein
MAELNKQQHWRPTFIDIEERFSEFVSTFRGGSKVTDLVQDIPSGMLNADFFLPEDKVIAELKCLQSDSADPETESKRIAESYVHLGYSGSDFLGWLFRGEVMPERVAQRVFATRSRSIVEAIKKANKQIRATKHLLNEPGAKGLVLIANDHNYGFTPEQILHVIARAFRAMSDCHTDCVVYFTPNVYHDVGDDIARTIWIPLYNVGREGFADFVNEFGAAWLDHAERLGTPYLTREVGDDLLDKVAKASPVAALRRRDR